MFFRLTKVYCISVLTQSPNSRHIVIEHLRRLALSDTMFEINPHPRRCTWPHGERRSLSPEAQGTDASGRERCVVIGPQTATGDAGRAVAFERAATVSRRNVSLVLLNSERRSEDETDHWCDCCDWGLG
jgi:hypothetical protein